MRPMLEPILSLPPRSGHEPSLPFAAAGESFSVMEWRGNGPRSLHIHHADDEAWHVLEGTLRFHFADRSVEIPAGGTVYVPAGVPHTYEALDARYLIVLTPRLAALIAELQRAPAGTDYPAVYRRYESTLLE
jgi:hypothetical protein